MFKKIAIDILGSGLTAIVAGAPNEKNKIGSVFKEIAAHPIKVVASFIAAPLLIIKIAWMVENPWRRAIAIIGLFLSLVSSYFAATFLGTLAGAVFVTSKIGFITGIGFLIGTTLSIYLSVIFSIIVLNAVSYVFLKISSQEVVDYLKEMST